jgi:hypothetical protein
MNDPVTLLFGVHAHQPAGNFPEVIENAHVRCYRPFLQTLHAYPDFRFALHCSGALLDALCENFPDDVRMLDDMVRRGQVELFGGGDMEPVLATIPDRDRRGQLNALSRKLATRFGQAPRGAWLTERVWEATVVPALAECGIHYVTVDDYHFLCTGRRAGELDGFFSTEESGSPLDLFPISEALRYRIPFSPAAEAVSYIESLARQGRAAAAIYFDDIEKFGIWPDTHEWVYGRGWLKEFVEGVLASSRIVTSTYDAFHRSHRTRGIAYLPTTAYIEMNEWTLPVDAAGRYVALVRQEKDNGGYGDTKPFLRGGIWKNFLSLYPEANWMHKRMLGLSARLAALPANPALTSLLYAAQANDAYWHGLFGGIYLPHLRRGVYRALIALESALDRLAPRRARARDDLDRDGIDEIFIHNDALQAVIADDGRAAIRELDSYALAHNFGDTFRRHPEHYHRVIAEGDRTTGPATGIASAHDRVSYRHAIGPSDIVPDESARTLFTEEWLPSAGAPTKVAGYKLVADEPAEAAAHFRAACGGATIDKRIALAAGRVDVAYRITDVPAGRFRTELDLAMPSCDGVGGRLIHGEATLGGFGQPVTLGDATDLTLDDRFLGGSVVLHCSRAAQIVARPYHTVSQSEAGFERIMQSVTVTLSWTLDRGEHEITVSLAVVPHRPGTAAPPASRKTAAAKSG